MPIEIFTIDAFAEQPFQGNPAAVCFLPEARDDAFMQAVAREMNLSETAFLVARDDGYSLRWFTPAVEIDLCGHATLASAHALWQSGRLPATETARFHTRSGELLANRRDDHIELDFPATAPAPCAAPNGLESALGARACWLGKSRFDYLVELDSEAAVRDLDPDFAGLRRLGVRGVMVTARAQGQEFDFVSRYFAPGSGIDEDPVTGSAHCALAPFWSERLGKTRMTAYQASARGGVVGVRLAGERVYLTGRAVTILRGHLEL